MKYSIDKTIFIEHALYDDIYHSIKNYEEPYYTEMIRYLPEDDHTIEHALWINITTNEGDFIAIEGILILVENGEKKS